VKLSPRRPRRDYNPVERAPRIPSTIALREPDETALASLDEFPVDPAIRSEVEADHSFADAVHKLNEGELSTAEGDLLAFARMHPRHSAADNALYLAGSSGRTGAIAKARCRCSIAFRATIRRVTRWSPRSSRRVAACE